MVKEAPPPIWIGFQLSKCFRVGERSPVAWAHCQHLTTTSFDKFGRLRCWWGLQRLGAVLELLDRRLL